MDILELIFRDGKIIKYKYLTENKDIIDLIDTFFISIDNPILSKYIPINITSKISFNEDKTINIIFNKIN